MNILLCADISKTNQYVYLLKSAYEKKGCQVMLGFNNFIKPVVFPDIIHIQWPEFFYKWNNEFANFKKIKKIINDRLTFYSNINIPIIYTVHNLLPHDSKLKTDKIIYDLIIDNIDVFIHHGQASIDIFKNKYPKTTSKKHIICPHGNYPVSPKDYLQSRKKYNLPRNKCIYLNFGKQRAYKGENFIKRVFSDVHKDAYLFIIGPKEYSYSNEFIKYTNLFRSKLIAPFVAFMNSFFSNSKKIILRRVSNREIPDIFSAVDIVFLGHCSGLNSGLLALSASYRKPIVYPEIGNFSEQLEGWQWKEAYEVNNID